VAAGLELDPRVPYPPFFNQSVDGVMHTIIPTTTDPITAHLHDNLRVDPHGHFFVDPKPREAIFASFADYRRRLSDALASAMANAPSFEPVESGVPRGSSGEIKRAVSATIHVDGPAAMAPATCASLESFAAAEGSRVQFRRRSFPAWQRAILKASRKLGAESIAWRFEQPKLALGALEPSFGSLLLRWAVSVVRPRYE